MISINFFPGRSFAISLLLIAASFIPSPGYGDDAYLATIWVGDGRQVLEDGVMIVSGGKITAIGHRSEIAIPPGVELHRLEGSTLIPGLVIAQSSLAEGGRDEDEAITPAIRAIDGFDFFGKYESLLAAGITTIQISPGNRRLMPGQGGVVKLAGSDPVAQTLSDQESLRILLTQTAFDPPRIYEPPVGAVSVDRPLEPTRPQLAGNLGDAVAGLRALWRAARVADQASDPILQTLATWIAGGKPVQMTARTPAEIVAAWQLVEECQFPVLLVGVDAVDGVQGAIPWDAEALRGIILQVEEGTSRLVDEPLEERAGSGVLETWQRVLWFKRLGVLSKTALTAPSSETLGNLWFVASRCQAAGLAPAEVLAMLTSIPARLLAVDHRVGTLAVGQDADFVVLSAAPLAPQSRVLRTYIDGKIVYQRKHDEKTTLLQGAKVYSSQGVVEAGQIVIQGTTIRAVGVGISSPQGAQVVDYPEGHIVPGFVDVDLRIGAGGALNDRVALNEKLGSFLASDDRALARVRQGGITTGLLASSVKPSPVVAFKLGDVPRVVADPVAIRYAIAGNLTSEEGKLRTILATAKIYVEAWRQYDRAYEEYRKNLAQYEQAKAKYDTELAQRKKKEEQEQQKKEEQAKPAAPSPTETKPTDAKPPENKPPENKPAENKPADAKPAETKPAETKPTEAKSEAGGEQPLVEPKKPEEPPKPRLTEALEPYRAMFEGKIKAIVEVDSGLAAQLAIQLFVDEYKLPLVLGVSGTAYREAEKIAGKKVPVLLIPPLEINDNGATIEVGEHFRTAGATVAIASGAGTGAKHLATALAYAVYHGLGREDALRGITSVPAEIFGLPQIGVIAPQRDADLVVLSGPPMEPASRVLAVMIDGVWVYRAETEEPRMEFAR